MLSWLTRKNSTGGSASFALSKTDLKKLGKSLGLVLVSAALGWAGETFLPVLKELSPEWLAVYYPTVLLAVNSLRKFIVSQNAE